MKKLNKIEIIVSAILLIMVARILLTLPLTFPLIIFSVHIVMAHIWLTLTIAIPYLYKPKK